MAPRKAPHKRKDRTSRELGELRAQLAEAQETLRAIREGEVDAVVVVGSKGEQVFSLSGADRTYRLIVETMNEAALTVTTDGLVLFCNQQFGRLLDTPIEQILGRDLASFVPADQRTVLSALLEPATVRSAKGRLVLRARRGHHVPVRVSVGPLQQPDGLAVCIVATDLTELENSTELIRQLRSGQNALREAQDWLALATGTTGVGLFEWDVTAHTVRWTDAHGVILGYPPRSDGTPPEASVTTEHPYSHWADRVHPEDRTRLEEEARSSMQDGRPFDAEYRVFWPDGSEHWVETRGFFTRDPAGRMLGVALDVTGRKQAEDTLRRHNATLEGVNAVLEAALTCHTEQDLGGACLGIAQRLTNSPFGFIGDIDAEGLHDVAIINPGWDACQVIDGGGHRIDPRTFRVHGIYGRVILDGRGLFTNDPDVHPDRVGLPAGHPPLTAFLGVPLLRDGRPVGMVGVGNRPGGYSAADRQTLESLSPAIVEAFMRQRAEQALQEANLALERRVAERTSELAERATQLRALAGELTLAEQRERRRIAKVAHDHLQQLLIALKFRLTVLGRTNDRVVQQAVDEIEPLLDTCIQAARSLTAELSPPILHEGGLRAGLEWLVRWMADTHGLAVGLAITGPFVPLADDVKVLLFESVRELLFNAVKHSRAQSAMVTMQTGDGQVVVVVSDQGAGFDPNAIPAAVGKAGGFGLFGIRERLDLIGGRMEIQSASGQGCRFSLTVPTEALPATQPGPLTAAVPPGRARQPAPPVVAGKIRVVLADDHTVMREGVAGLLGREPDIEIVGQAPDGRAAVELAAELLPDVILMDMNMPGLDGLEATRAIHTDHSGIRVIGLSMFDDDEHARALREAGAVDYLSKSGPPERLIAAIRRCMGEQEAKPGRRPATRSGTKSRRRKAPAG
jgi:PAS domain S-box-containing protein